MSAFDELRREREKKLELLAQAGMDAFPARTGRTRTGDAFLAAFDQLLASGVVETLAGRVLALRGQGGILFADLFDGTARVQVVLQKGEISDALLGLFGATVDRGDFIALTGKAYRTKRGESSLLASGWTMLAKSLRPLPDSWVGLRDDELKLRLRDIDILLDSELRALFRRRAQFWGTIRSFLAAEGFLEVETPVLETVPGGADARPFVTHHNALDIPLYLRISAGELWQKRLLVAGFPAVFEIGRIFRNEGMSSEHLQDYTQMELYQAYGDFRSGMKLVQRLYRAIADEVYGRQTFSVRGHEVDLAGEWPTISFVGLMRERFGIDPVSCSTEEAIAAAERAQVPLGVVHERTRVIDTLWKSVRKGIAGPAFLVDVPVALEPLAKRSESNPELVERFQVVLAGSEMGKGFSELNDPRDQRARFEEQERLRAAGDDEAQRLDEQYLEAMEYGMPPAFGFGVSERLFAFLEDKPAHLAQLFPLLRPKK